MTDSWKKSYKKIDRVEGWLVPGQEKVLYDFASQLKDDSTVVEIGSFRGRSTACLGLGGKNKRITIYAIDTFAGNSKDFTRGNQFSEKQFLTSFEKNMKMLGLKNVVPLQGYSQEIGRRWKISIDLLFIDGSHIYEDVKSDFELFFPWVKPGGLVLFHDVSDDFPGVYKVWQQTARDLLSHRGNFKTLYFGNKPTKYFYKVKLLVHKTKNKFRQFPIIKDLLTRLD